MNGPAQQETRRFGALRAVAALACLGASLGLIVGVLRGNEIGALSVLVGAGTLIGAFGALVAVRLRRQHRDVRSIPPEAGSLRRLRYFFPHVEFLNWIGEVVSHLAEAENDDAREQYRRSYLRGLPNLFWATWSAHLTCRCQCRRSYAEGPLPKRHKRPRPPGAQPTDPPFWRFLFALIGGPKDQWYRGLILFAVAGLLLIGALLATTSRTDGAVLVTVTALALSRLWRR